MHDGYKSVVLDRSLVYRTTETGPPATSQRGFSLSDKPLSLMLITDIICTGGGGNQNGNYRGRTSASVIYICIPTTPEQFTATVPTVGGLYIHLPLSCATAGMESWLLVLYGTSECWHSFHLPILSICRMKLRQSLFVPNLHLTVQFWTMITQMMNHRKLYQNRSLECEFWFTEFGCFAHSFRLSENLRVFLSSRYLMGGLLICK